MAGGTSIGGGISAGSISTGNSASGASMGGGGGGAKASGGGAITPMAVGSTGGLSKGTSGSTGAIGAINVWAAGSTTAGSVTAYVEAQVSSKPMASTRRALAFKAAYRLIGIVMFFFRCWIRDCAPCFSSHDASGGEF